MPMDSAKKRALKVRLLTAAVIVPIVLVLTWKASYHWGFTALITALAGIGLFEYYSMLETRGITTEALAGIVGGTLVAFSGHFNSPVLTSGALYTAWLVVSIVALVRGQRAINELAGSLFGVAYVGWFGGHINLLRGIPRHGAGLVTLLLVAVALTDTAAYLVGSRIGRHKMAPAISPHKSWEGSIGGLVFALLGMLLLYYVRAAWGVDALPPWGLPRYLAVGAALSAVAQLGDFVESALKRDAGVKDSGMIFPGHGGVLDRCDGFLYAAPVLYYVAVPWLGH